MRIFILLLSVICLAQESFPQRRIHVAHQYENNKPRSMADSFYHSFANTIFISLDEGFDDSLVITINDTTIMNSYFKTNESIGHAGSFGVSFKDSSEVILLKIRFINGGRYLEERLNLRYKSLQVRGLRNWLLIYTNQFPMRM